MGIGAAVIASAVIGAGTSYYQSEQQKDLAEEEADRLAKEAASRKAEAERIARETRPEAETVEAIQFGVPQDEELGSVSDFLIPRQSTALGTASGSSGLGFSV